LIFITSFAGRTKRVSVRNQRGTDHAMGAGITIRRLADCMLSPTLKESQANAMHCTVATNRVAYGRLSLFIRRWQTHPGIAGWWESTPGSRKHFFLDHANMVRYKSNH